MDGVGASTSGGASLASWWRGRGIAGAAHLGGYGAWKMMGAGAKQRGDHDGLTKLVDFLMKAVVRAEGDGFSLQVEADGSGAPR
jgi:hypothetical protein